MLKFIKGLTLGESLSRRKSDPREGEPVDGVFKEVAFNSRTKKTLVKDGEEYLVVVGTNKSFVDTLRTLRYLKFGSMEEAIEFFKRNGEEYEGQKDPTAPDSK